MGRTVAVVWHASFSIAAGVLYFFFVLPRWPELLGDTSHTLGTVLRIVTGALIGLAALPVVFTLLRTRRPEFGTPQLALRLRTSSIALHVLAGALITGTAVSEIWFSVDRAGQWLFGIYGAPLRSRCSASSRSTSPSRPNCRRLRPNRLRPRRPSRAGAVAARPLEDAGDDVPETEDEAATEDDTEESPESESDDKPAEVATDAEEPESTAEEPEVTAEDEASDTTEPESTNGKLGNHRPSGKTSPRRRRRLRGGVAVED